MSEVKNSESQLYWLSSVHICFCWNFYCYICAADNECEYKSGIVNYTVLTPLKMVPWSQAERREDPTDVAWITASTSQADHLC